MYLALWKWDFSWMCVPVFFFLFVSLLFFSIPWGHSLISIESTESIFPRSCSKQSMTPLGSRKLQQVWHFLLLTFASVGERIEEKKKHEVWRKLWYPRERKPWICFFFNSFLKMFCFFFLLVFFMLFPYFFFSIYSTVDLFWLPSPWDIILDLLICFD